MCIRDRSPGSMEIKFRPAITAVTLKSAFLRVSDVYKRQVEEERFARGDLWNCIGIKQYDEEKDPYLKTMKKLGETLETLLKNKEEFDILINDEALKPNYLQGYVQVIVLK